MSPGGPRLHLGCGERYLDGYVNIDFPPTEHTVQLTSKADLYADITALTYPEGSVSEVRLHHVFEHFDRATALRLLIDWQAWLAVGGRLVIETPDVGRSVRAFLFSRRERDRARILRHVFGSSEAPWAVHYDGWYRAKFESHLTALGYSGLTFHRSAWHGTYNITVQARKRETLPRDSQIAAARELLRNSLIDESESERRLLEVWMTRLAREPRAPSR